MKKMLWMLLIVSPISMAAGNANVDRYTACIKNNSIKYSKTNEAAETVARATVASCAVEMQKAVESNEFWQYASPESKANLIAKMKAAGEDLSIKTVLDERLK
ncbi:TPA: hypothetical protein PPE37_000434 [Escherichia coli]|nr:hypothetical protein [Escherichia coli]